jgi:GT2 family glycosyltransferase
MSGPAPSGMSPGLTIGIPTLRRLAFLREAVASALAQERCDVEVIISQDAGADGVLDGGIRAWALAAAAGDPRARYVAAEAPLGLAGNWNRVAQLARGEFLAIIGDDDRLLPAFADTLLTHADAADVVFCNHHLIDETGERLPAAAERATARFGRHGLAAGPQRPAAACVWRNAVAMSACVIRTAVARTLGFDAELNTPDIEFFARAAAAGSRFHFVPDYLSEYRTHSGSATAAGLTMSRLLWALADVPVPDEAAPIKRAFLRECSREAVRAGLLRGDVSDLRRTLASPYAQSGTARVLRLLGRVPLAGTPALTGAAWTYRAGRTVLVRSA